jgi:uncharacterized membrane protein
MNEITGIDLAAPVIARHEIDVRAPLPLVWDLLVDVGGWPAWNGDITSATVEETLAPGVAFRWETGGLSLTSTVHAIAKHDSILWDGTAQGITGIHRWRFSEAPEGVRVATEESWSGEPIHANPAAMQAMLDQSLVSWLGRLKETAEARARSAESA